MTVTNDKLYEALNDTRVELSNKIEDVVKGPITDLQKRVGRLEVSSALQAFKVYVIVGIIASLMSIITTVVVTVIVSKLTGTQ